mmetsp:Transcript_102105/g.152975  ORF Transcript_102105/g.152975 Transcript_102105/m.152975 type:complete len:595 (-) Transcript_102105:1149-2933(-)
MASRSKNPSLWLLCLIASALATVVEGDIAISSGPVKCLLVQTDQLCPDESCPPLENDGWHCNDDHGITYALVGLAPEFFTSGKLNTGRSVLSLSKAIKKRNEFRHEIIVDPGSKVKVEPFEHQTVENGVGIMLRGSQTREGNDNSNGLDGERELLMVYVRSLDSSPTYNFATVTDDVFGTRGDQVNLVSQYKACSKDKLIFVGAHKPSEGIRNGAVAITIPHNTKDVSRHTVENYVDAYLEDNGYNWLTEFDHIMYVLPAGTEFFGALAYADGTNKKTVYNDISASSITTQMHEIGHNLGMSHSGQGEQTYGDRSCYMGAAFAGNPKNAPAMCFNAAKSWYTRWYPMREVGANGWRGQLVGVDDFVNAQWTSGPGGYKRTLLKIPHPGDIQSEDLYIMYNRAKGINRDVVEGRDKVVIVKGPPLSEVYEKSWAVAELDASENSVFISPEHGISGTRLVIEVTEMVQNPSGTRDYARVEVRYDSSPTPAPTSCVTGELRVDVTTDNYPEETSWEVKVRGTNEVVASGSGYLERNKEFSEEFCLGNNGPFEFKIKDSFGDGNCCLNGNGEYAVWFNGREVKRGGNFGSSELVRFSG